MKAVIAENLSKVFPQGKKALNGIGFSLEPGEIFGFLGPNGAGKTTTVKLLNGMMAPSKGTCRVFGIDPAIFPEKVHGMSGVVTEHAQMYDNLTGLQNLIFYGTLFGLSANETEKRVRMLLEYLELTEAGDRKLATYSTGMRQRLSLARAMIHKPDILFLDEPTSGLDPESAKSVNDLIKRLACENGTTIFLCTHQLRYAEEICTCYGLVDQGVLLAVGDIETLRLSVCSGLTVTVKTDRLPEGIEFRSNQGGYYDINVVSEQEIPAIVKRIVEGNGKLYHVSARKLTLEEIYFALIEQQKTRRR